MLIAVSGSQGAGKSSVLSCLEERGYQVIKHKTARTVLAGDEWDGGLEAIYNDPDSICRFQLQLVERKWIDEIEHLHNSDNICFTERTFLDLFAYAASHVGNKNTYSDWVNSYFDRCVECQAYYKHVFFIRGGIFEVEHDNVRPSNVHYTRMIDLFMNDYIPRFSKKVDIIDFDGIEQRADFIEQQIQYLKG